jgi:mannose-6-phosphate isomerase
VGPDGVAGLGGLGEAIARPLPLDYHPLYRFYEGGSLTRDFRALPGRPDDWWSEDWVGSCTVAGNEDPDGRPQGLSTVDLPGIGPVTLADLVQARPEEMVGADFAGRWGPITGVLVKLLSPAGPVPVHAHPTRDWARRHLGSPFGKTEAWILLDTPGDGAEPAHAAAGLRPGIDRDWFAAAVRRRDGQALRGALHRTEVHPGEVYVAHGGVPHYLGPRISFIEVQEPTDHIVIAETSGDSGGSGDDDAGATMGLGWDLALDMIDYTGVSAEQAFARARQEPRVLRTSHGSREVRLFADDVLPFFDATALEVADEIDVPAGRFSVAIVAAGSGSIEGDFGRWPVRRGETFALPASLAFRVRAGAEPVRVIRCFGPGLE